MAVEPSPRSDTVIGLGWSWSKGVSGAVVWTPWSRGYSKLMEWAMIYWPAWDTKKATNCSAAAGCLDDSRIPAPETSRT
jgi:hypothetical protein